MALGIVFLGIGLAISTFSRTRVQSLVAALLTWCFFVFVFDLIALSMIISTKAPAAAQEIEIVCDAMHINAAADIHSGYDNLTDDKQARPVAANRSSRLGWLTVNPIDLFRAVNLSQQLELRVPIFTSLFAITLWLASMLGASLWKLHRTDL